MKKLVRTLFAATSILMMALFALSCTNEPIEMERSVEITIMPEGTLAPFSAVKDRLEMYNRDDGTAKVRLTILMYDEKGDLIESKETLLKNFNENYTFNVMTPSNGNSRIVCYASCILGTLNNVKYEAYTITGKDCIQTITIRQNNYNNFFSSWNLLGYGEYLISENASNYVNITMEPLVAFVRLGYVIPSTLPDVDAEYLIRFENNDIMKYNGAISSYDTSLAEGKVNYDELSTSSIAEYLIEKPGLKYIYTDCTFFPNTNMYYDGKYLELDETITAQYSFAEIKSGKVYTINLYCESMACTINDGITHAPARRTSAYISTPWQKIHEACKFSKSSIESMR